LNYRSFAPALKGGWSNFTNLINYRSFAPTLKGGSSNFTNLINFQSAVIFLLHIEIFIIRLFLKIQKITLVKQISSRY